MAVVLLASVAGCGSECYENQNALPLAEFYVNDTAQIQVAIDSVEVIGVGSPNDSVLWDGGTTDKLYLPFRVTSDTTAYRFHRLNSGLEDVVTFVYDRAPVFVSEACGVSYEYRIKDITWQGTMIDSVTCPGGVINNVNATNLYIYFRP